MINTGTQVRGKYYGHSFSGKVVDRRPHSMNNGVIYFVELDAEIVVFGDPRTALAVTTGEDVNSIEAV